ncbi:MAG: filamentous hemagglutinin, partial [Verrucomicrobia bacterium]|nr:filamentous hemagglutinin [Verrucomicrobiota bacterium]
TITAKALTITGATVADRIYDGTTDAPVSGGTLNGVVGSEDVQLRALAASYADANVGNAKVVVNTGFSLTGADIGNYTLTQPTLTGKVDPKNLYVAGVTAVTRAYDRTTNVALAGTAVLSGLVTGESLTLDTNNAAAGLADRNAGTNKAVTVTGFAVTGATAGNYNLVQAPNLTVDITPKTVSLGGLTNVTKEYDGTTAISLSGISGLTGVISPDDVQLGGSATGQFADALVGANKPVAVTGATLTGADAANYALDANLPVTGEITKRRLVLSGAAAQDKFYDGTTTATLSGGVLTGIVGGEDVRFSANPTANFTTNTVGTNIPVAVNLNAGIVALSTGGGGGATLTGTNAGNYLVIQPTGISGSIH